MVLGVAWGLRGIAGIGRKFRIIDDDGNRQLSLEEFSKAIKEHALDFTKEVRGQCKSQQRRSAN